MTIREILEAKNGDVKKIDKEINTGKFFDAVQSEDCDKVRYFIHSGIDVNTKDKYGWTGLMNAADENKKKMVRLLIELGADVNVRDNEGQTALMRAAFVNAGEVAAILIREGADIDVKDNLGQTPFMMAALSNSQEVAEVLVKFGADVDAVDNKGKKALDIANLSFANFFKGEAIREKVNLKRLGRILESYPNFNKYGLVRGFKDIYRQKYGHDLYKACLDRYLEELNSKSEKNGKIIKIIGEDEIQVVPSDRAVQQFLDSEFANKDYGYESDVCAKFLEKYQYELPADILRNFIIKFTEDYADKILKKFDDGRIKILPSKEIVQKFLHYEFIDKDYGYIGNISEINTRFYEKYKSELPRDILADYIRDPGLIFHEKALKEIDEERLRVVPNLGTIQMFLASEFADKDYGYIGTISEINTRFYERYKSELPRDILIGYIRDPGLIFQEKVIREIDNGILQIVPKLETIQKFLVSEFADRDYGYIGNISEINTRFYEKYKSELPRDILADYIRDSGLIFKEKALKKIDNGRLRVVPNLGTIQMFLASEFADKDYGYIGTISEINTRFYERYKSELPRDILVGFIRCSENCFEDKAVREICDGRLQVVPKRKNIHQFLISEFADKDYGYISEISTRFYERYKSELPRDILIGYIRDFGRFFQGKVIKEIDNGMLQVVPSEDVIEKFLLYEFTDKDYVYESDVLANFLKKYRCVLTNDDLKDFTIKFNKMSNNKVLKNVDEGRLVLLSNDEIQNFLLKEFQRVYGTVIDKNEVFERFKRKYKCELPNTVLDEFIEFKGKNDIRILRKLADEKILIEPGVNEIQKFLSVEFEKEPGVKVYKNKICENFKNKYKCELDNYYLERYIDGFNSSGADKMIIRKDNIYEIAKYLASCVEKLSSIAIEIQRCFLAEAIGYFCSIDCIKNKLKCEYLQDEEIILAVQIANSNLRDIKIVIESDGNFKSSFKCTDMNTRDFDTNICPVCGERFSKYDNIHIRNHILGHSTFRIKDCSVLVETGKTCNYKETYFCNHCKQELAFDDDIKIIYMHLLGECKLTEKGRHSNYMPIEGNNFRNSIWKGTAYANGDGFLGNSGQLLREDNGRFGSYPLEDYYGDGDW
ncbi:MAG: ankyrin repeat domain-containing protein [Treponema sp.]|nr:ankyrin repeat domain-containing protein [Treponema sp.]